MLASILACVRDCSREYGTCRAISPAVFRALANILLHASSPSCACSRAFFLAVMHVVDRAEHPLAIVISASVKAFPRMPASIFALRRILALAEMSRARS